jgi:hypothetical protein
VRRRMRVWGGVTGLLLAAAASAAAGSPPHAPAQTFDLNCRVDGIHGPDGQPDVMDWTVDLAAQQACMGVGCQLKARAERTQANELRLTFPGATGGAQTMVVNLDTGAFAWRAVGARQYTGDCTGVVAKSQR